MKNQLIPLMGILISLALAAGMAVAGSDAGARVAGIPIFALCGVLAFVIQWVMFLPAWLLQTEKFYDLVGSLTYISVALLALFLSQHRELPRLLIAAMVVLWAARLGSFLFLRILATGEDSRFARIKPHFFRFLLTWTLQGLWVFMTFAAGLAAITAEGGKTMTPLVIVGTGIWAVGFLIEIVADEQKRKFRAIAANRDRFIDTGMWRYSRHPNYFGEILLWTGIAIAALPMLAGWQYLTLVSPVFVYLLLTRVSGVNMLEARAKQRWGDNNDYQRYCRRTPVLMINPFPD